MIPAELLKPFTSNVPPRLAQSRLELLEKLLAELGAESFAPEAVVRVKRPFSALVGLKRLCHKLHIPASSRWIIIRVPGGVKTWTTVECQNF